MDFVGKYDSRIFTLMDSVVDMNMTGIADYNDIVQQEFRSISQYFLTLISPDTVISYIDEIEKAFSQNMELGRISIAHSKIKIKNLRKVSRNDVKESVVKIAEILLGMIRFTSKIEIEEIKRKAYNLYKTKNKFYNDSWHINGEIGTFWDLSRKLTRLNTMICFGIESTLEDESLFDTMMDAFNYSVFMLTIFTI